MNPTALDAVLDRVARLLLRDIPAAPPLWPPLTADGQAEQP